MDLPILAYTAGISTAVPFLIGMGRTRVLPDEFRWLVGLFGFHALITLVQFILAFRGVNNLWSSQIYNVIEVLIFLWVLSQWTPSPTMRRVLQGSGIFYVIFWVVLKILVERFDMYSTYSSPISRIILVAAVTYVLFAIASRSERPVTRDPRFWIGSALLIACTGSLTFYGLRSFIADLPMETVLQAFSIHWGVVVVSNCFFSVGLLCKPLSLSSGGQLELAQ